MPVAWNAAEINNHIFDKSYRYFFYFCELGLVSRSRVLCRSLRITRKELQPNNLHDDIRFLFHTSVWSFDRYWRVDWIHRLQQYSLSRCGWRRRHRDFFVGIFRFICELHKTKSIPSLRYIYLNICNAAVVAP